MFMISTVLEIKAQGNISFRHLNTSHGLSYIGINDMSIDQQGNLWIGTDNGLNMFNGKSVEKYFTTEHPELQNDNIVHVTCDHQNRIWVLTGGGNTTIIDEKKNFHRLGLYADSKFIKTRWILKTQNDLLILFTQKGHFVLPDDLDLISMDSLRLDQLAPYNIVGFDTLQKKGYKQVFYYDLDNYLFVQENVFYKVNLTKQVVEGSFKLEHCTALVKWGDHALMAYDRTESKVKIFDLVTQQISYPFEHLVDQHGKPIADVFLFAEKITDTRYLLTTESSGIYIYDTSTNKILNFTHQVADITSIDNDNTTTIQVGQNGWVFVSTPAGISYFNSQDVVNNQMTFIDDKGRGYDGLIGGIDTKDNITYYMGTSDELLEWNRYSNTTQFISFTDRHGEKVPNKQYVISVLVDRLDQVWATTQTQGLIVFDKNKKLLQHFSHEEKGKAYMKLVRAGRVINGPDGNVWVSGNNGICKINPVTLEVDHLENTPLAKFDSTYCNPILFTDDDNLWIATNTKGVFHYTFSTGELVNYNQKNGLIWNGIFCLGVDNDKNIYVGTPKGLNIILTNGRIKTLTKKDGLLIDRAEGLLLDKHNRMWIGNDIGLACYTPADSSLITFDTRYGLSIYGFRVGSYFQTPNGEFAFGTPRGIQYFHPDSLYNRKFTFSTLIHKIVTKDIDSYISASDTFHLSPNDRQVTFYFSTIDYSAEVRTYYEYKLSGIDEDWIKVVDQNAVRYNSLPPGEFVFQVRVSNDNKHWQNAENQVTLLVAAHFYQMWWFQVTALLLIGWIIWKIVSRSRKKQQLQREELETEVVIHYFASQINQQKEIEAVLWDVAKNCISRLNLEECVIYLVDKERQVLVQKAAYGPKTAKDHIILQPIDIPVGQGITGNVTLSKKPEIVNNTEKDSRYIVDDERRLSEMAVPIIVNNEVIGVIDSENSQRNFFTPKHLSLMTTISILTANQIQRILAEEEKQKAEIEVLQNKQKATESRLQSLRLQMNPHFLFNALNSIQQMILANEEMVATRYLSRFSKLLRSILIHSDKEMISLKEELDILKLYVELESVRFKEAFSYQIDCDEDIDVDEVKIPTLLIQPFVENAIWHGLMHKEGMRNLKISFADQGDVIQCIVEDNGIGRQKAKEMKISTGSDKKHTSKGIEVSMERLKTMKKNGGPPGTMHIHDLVDAQGNPTGTRIEINLPIQN